MHAAIQSCVSAQAFTCIICGCQILHICRILWTIGALKPAHMRSLDELDHGLHKGGMQNFQEAEGTYD